MDHVSGKCPCGYHHGTDRYGGASCLVCGLTPGSNPNRCFACGDVYDAMKKLEQ